MDELKELRQAIKKHGVYKLAKELDIPISKMKHIAYGTRNMTVSEAKTIASAIGWNICIEPKEICSSKTDAMREVIKYFIDDGRIDCCAKCIHSKEKEPCYIIKNNCIDGMIEYFARGGK